MVFWLLFVWFYYVDCCFSCVFALVAIICLCWVLGLSWLAEMVIAYLVIVCGFGFVSAAVWWSCFVWICFVAL